MAEYLSKFTGVRVDSAVEKIPASLPTEDSSIIVINKDGMTGYTTLSSLGAGDVVASGNNAFTGNNTFAGSSTFNGDVTMAKTPTIPGYAKLADANEFTAANNFIYKNTTAALQTTIKLDAEDGGITVGFGGIGTIAQYVKISSMGISHKPSGVGTAVLNYDLPSASGTLALTTDIDGCAKLASENTFTANNIFTSALFSGGVDFDGNNNRFRNGFATNSFTDWDGTKTFTVPSKTGILALTDDIASAVAGLAERNFSNEFTANNYFAYNKGIDIGEKSVAPPWLAIRNDETAAAGKIAFLYHDGDAENTQNVAYFPAQSGVIALTPTTTPTEESFVVYGTDFKPKWIKGSNIPSSGVVSELADRLTKIETLLAPGLATTNPRALYWLLTE